MRTINCHIIVLLAIFSLTLTCCKKRDNNKSESTAQAKSDHNEKAATENDVINYEDNVNSTEKDYKTTLSDLEKELKTSLDEIKDLEQNVSGNKLNDNPDLLNQCRDNLAQINISTRDKAKRLSQLEESINNGSNKLSDNEKLSALNTVASLKKQLSIQQEKLVKLNRMLNQSNSNTQTTSENTTDTTQIVTTTQDTESQAKPAVNESNECYFTMGTAEELKKHKILGSGFLQKTKILQTSSIMHTYFTKANKNTLNEIKLSSATAKVVTHHDLQSFSIDNGVLKIHDQDLFWQQTNYLVIQVE